MKIYLSILNEGWVSDELTIKLPRWLEEAKQQHHTVYFESSKIRPIENNRNTIVKRFLDSDFDYLLQMDNDNIPAKNPLELVNLNLDIVSCPVWIYQHKLILNIYKFDEKKDYLIPVEYDENKDLIEIDATGTGVILCSRKVLESVKRPFERLFDENGIQRLGLDLAFSEKARNEGFKLYSNMKYICKHNKMIDLSLFNIQSH